MLIHVASDRLVNIDTIASVKLVYRNDRPGAEVVFSDGRREVLNTAFEDFELAMWPIVPAPPGFSVIIAFPPDKDDEPTTFDTVMVIAFRLTNGEPYPLTPWGRLTDHTWALVWPNGKADEQWNRIWPNVEAFKASFGSRGVRS